MEFTGSEEEDEDEVVFDESSRPASALSDKGQSAGDERARLMSPDKTGAPLRWQYLYIQMEFCEKSTLRNIIDSGELHKDMKRIWKLFREIVEGLAYIHEQGLIHRDLKPVNVFLSSDDHVKIGDFGLATTSMTRGLTGTPHVTPLTTPHHGGPGALVTPHAGHGNRENDANPLR
jgi:translation initiation factor 2-alpha kinase 4